MDYNDTLALTSQSTSQGRPAGGVVGLLFGCGLRHQQPDHLFQDTFFEDPFKLENLSYNSNVFLIFIQINSTILSYYIYSSSRLVPIFFFAAIKINDKSLLK